MAATIARVVGSGIGLAREAYLSKNDKEPGEQDTQAQQGDSTHSLQPPSNQARPRSPSPVGNDYGESAEENEYLWKLDDAQEREEGKPQPFANAQTEKELFQEFQAKHPPPEYTAEEGKLPCPVCIPQRRPKHKTRGFIRAYSPVLLDVGISQEAFMDFLAGFDQAIKMHQAFNIVQVIVRGADLAVQISLGPHIGIHICTWVLHASIDASRRAYVTYKTNEYLDEMNANYFKQYGVYALIMCYNPSKKDQEPTDSIEKAVSTRAYGEGDKFQSASGTVHDELEIPESAPLVFPRLDAADESEKKNAIKRSGAFLSDYYDRRAQAKFDYNNPDSKLTVAPRKEFHSRYADPNGPAVNGGLLGLVSGGKIKAPRYLIKERRRKSKLEKGVPAGHHSILSEDVYYLLIVNVPTEEELNEAREILLREGA